MDRRPLRFIQTCLFGVVLFASCNLQQHSPGERLKGDWMFVEYEYGDLDYEELMGTLFLRIGPCATDSPFCQARFVPFDTISSSLDNFLDRQLEADFYLRDRQASLPVLQELGMNLPEDCNPCYTLQDQQYPEHIYTLEEVQDTLYCTLLSEREESERICLVRVSGEE